MAPQTPRRRVSYVIPRPTDPVPRLQLPPHGFDRTSSINPLLIPSHGHTDPQSPRLHHHPRHRLGVAALALDTTTQLAGRPSPEGILYTGGRDGLIISWDLGIPMKPRNRKYGSASRGVPGRWEFLTGWGDDIVDDDHDEDEVLPSDGDILGEVKGSARRRRRSNTADGSIPFGERWETDVDAFIPGHASSFRQSAQIHADWVNDLLLCNLNQTVVSASADGSIKAWSPHLTTPSEPVTIGTHSDYVRCLAQSREQEWVASGSFDRTVKLWDLSRSSQDTSPIVTLNPPESSGPKSSIYALAADTLGHTIVSGGPERVIRMWDPRAGKRIGKLVGHTDNIRSILISEDSKYMLTASADASIKLWSMLSQRCLHTFTHHTDSVWALHSTHPSLEIFYSGDRSGFVCKVDVEGCTDMSEGECVVICQDTGEHGTQSDGINKIVAMDDNLLWTASGSSSLKRWRVPSRRALRAAALTGTDSETLLGPPESPLRSASASLRRKSGSIDTFRSRPRSITLDLPSTTPPAARSPRHSNSMSAAYPPHLDSNDSTSGLDHGEEGETKWYGLPFESLVRLTSPHDPFTPFSPVYRGRDGGDVATLYSAASLMSVTRPPVLRSPLQSIFPPPPGQLPRPGSPSQSEVAVPTRFEGFIRSARAEFEEREVVGDAIPLDSVPDEIIEGERGLVRAVMLNNRMHALTVDTCGEVAVWDVVRGHCVGKYLCTDLSSASFSGSTVSEGSAGRDPSPRESLEIVRERIEGEAVVLPWSTVDTKTGVLTVHLNDKCFEAEVYADEAGCPLDRQGPDDQRVNLGKWVLRNLFSGFIREEQRAYSRRVRGHESPPPASPNSTPRPAHHVPNGLLERSTPRRRSSSSLRQASSPTNSTILASPTMLPALQPDPAAMFKLALPVTKRYSATQALSPIMQSPQAATGSSEATPVPVMHQRSQTEAVPPAAGPPGPGAKENDYFSLRVRRTSLSANGPTTPDDFSGWSGPATKPDAPLSPTTPGGGLIGRLKTFGKRKGPGESGAATPKAGPTTSVAQDSLDAARPVGSTEPTPAQALLAGVLTPPTAADGPTLHLSPNIPLIMSEEVPSGWRVIYRGTVHSASQDIHTLEETMPMWLLEYLLLSKAPAVTVTKIGFVLLPYQSKDPGDEKLPELLNTSQSKLTASRFLRVRKLTIHVQDKLDRISGTQSTAASPRQSPRSSLDGRTSIASGRQPAEGRPRPEDAWEILCNDQLLPLDMTLAAVRQYAWRQAGELTMHYRRRRPSPARTPPVPALPSNLSAHLH
ncbi:WD40 repeat-like protein [Auriscalpium vulgare]|uniref:WD40 repeat-like protein n=1 Tax=Auriscalpium vulgare TaxID=40419 RepID=A0ACB8S878_9AGAM|nr:WD40 repeat-like protein [Auriscalpium vulgare]